MSHNKKITLLAALAMICIGFFLFYGLGNWEYSCRDDASKCLP